MATAHPTRYSQNPAKLELSPAFLFHQKSWGLREKVRHGQVRHGEEEEEEEGLAGDGKMAS